jgi:hypothetical protein
MQAYYAREAKILAAVSNAATPYDAYYAKKDVSDTFNMEEETKKYYDENVERLKATGAIASEEVVDSSAPYTEGLLAANPDGTYAQYRNGAWVTITKAEYDAAARNQ